MSPEDIQKHILTALMVTRENIARAKSWIVEHFGSNTNGMAVEWLRLQGFEDKHSVDLDSPEHLEALNRVAMAYGLRLAFYQAVWELINSGVIVPSAPPSGWVPTLETKTSRHAGGVRIDEVNFCYPERIQRSRIPSSTPSDADLFLKGIDCKTLHSGILEAIDQSLQCFRRGLYLPATAMLGAAAEATWTECGNAIAKKLPSPTLQNTLANEPSFAKLVSEIRKALEPKTSKPLLDSADRTIYNIHDAEIWTTTLRERRNALHWGKAKSFIADHSETGTLLMAAPQHLGTLEALRAVC